MKPVTIASHDAGAVERRHTVCLTHGHFMGSPGEDPPGPESGQRCTARGGAVEADAKFARSATRYPNDPFAASIGVGFRVVRKLSPGPD